MTALPRPTPMTWTRPLDRRVMLSALLALVSAGCGGGGIEEGGKVVVDGSSTVFRISRQAQLAYNKEKPEVTVNVGNHGTGGGFGRYLQGEVDIVDASRDAKPEEQSRAESNGLAWTRFVVGYDGITVVVNPENQAVSTLTVDQLKKLYAPESQVQTWKDLDPAWPAEKIVLYAPDTDSGTFEYFHEAILGPDIPKQQRPDVQPSPDDNVLVRGVEGDLNGIGYFGFAYYNANQEGLKAVAIQDGPDANPVAPSLETILKGDYKPLSRPLYIFVKNAALKRPEVAGFVRYYLDNADRFASKAGYVPPTEADRKANTEALAKAVGPATSTAATKAKGTE